MLRLIVLVLLLANGAYYAWSHGYLLAWGVGPTQQSEPQRLDQQIKPGDVRILRPGEVRAFDSSALAAGRAADCLQAGPLDDSVTGLLRTALQTWPAGSFSFEPAVEPSRWIVYMGKYSDAENLSRKKAELRQIGVSFEALVNPTLELGLSLGGFATEAAATQHLDLMTRRGVRTARVVQERPEVRGQALRFPALDDVLRARLDELRPTLERASLRPCR